MTLKNDQTLKPTDRHIHWLLPGAFSAPTDLITSNMASIRMRAGLVCHYGLSSGLTISLGDHIDSKAHAVVIGKIGADAAQKGRDEHWLTQLRSAKQAGRRIFMDYTDHHLGQMNSPMRPFYQQVLSLIDEAIVSSEQMKAHLALLFSGDIHTISDPLEVPIVVPKAPREQGTKSVLWFGHATNIPYLMEYLGNHHLCDQDFNLWVLSNDVGLRTLASKPIQVRGQIQVHLVRWSLSDMRAAAGSCDACIIPSNPHDPSKSGASSNRLMTSLAMGLPTLAESLSSYRPYEKYYGDIRTMKLSEFFRRIPTEIGKVIQAQREVLPEFTVEVLAKRWLSVLDRS